MGCIPDTGATAVELAKCTGFTLRRVRKALARLEELGRVMRLEVHPGTAWQWMRVAEEDWPT